MIKVVIFDLDGTVADTIWAIRDGINLVMKEMEYPEQSYDDVLGYVNEGTRKFVSSALYPYTGDDPDKVNLALKLYNKYYGEVYMRTDRLYDGVAELVEELSGKYILAMLSNKQDRMVKNTVSQLFRPGIFAATLGFIDGTPPKPEPDGALRLCGWLGVRPEECLLVGDSEFDYLTARNAGMKSVNVTWGYRSREFLTAYGITRLADTTDDIKEYIEELNSQEVRYD